MQWTPLPSLLVELGTEPVDLWPVRFRLRATPAVRQLDIEPPDVGAINHEVSKMDADAPLPEGIVGTPNTVLTEGKN